MRLILVNEQQAYRAHSPDLGLHSYGDTREEAIEEFIELARARGAIDASVSDPISLFTVTDTRGTMGCAGKSC